MDFFLIQEPVNLQMPTMLLALSIVLFSVLVVFLSLSLWAIFHKGVGTEKKIFVILSSYVLIWLACANFYYFAAITHQLVGIWDLLSAHVIDPESINATLLSLQNSTIKGFLPMWQYVSETGLVPANRLEGFVSTLYFSGVTIFTIGFGDMTPVSSFLRMMVIFEAAFGQIINVLAIGLWLSSLNLVKAK